MGSIFALLFMYSAFLWFFLWYIYGFSRCLLLLGFMCSLFGGCDALGGCFVVCCCVYVFGWLGGVFAGAFVFWWGPLSFRIRFVFSGCLLKSCGVYTLYGWLCTLLFRCSSGFVLAYFGLFLALLFFFARFCATILWLSDLEDFPCCRSTLMRFVLRFAERGYAPGSVARHGACIAVLLVVCWFVSGLYLCHWFVVPVLRLCAVW